MYFLDDFLFYTNVYMTRLGKSEDLLPVLPIWLSELLKKKKKYDNIFLNVLHKWQQNFIYVPEALLQEHI